MIPGFPSTLHPLSFLQDDLILLVLRSTLLLLATFAVAQVAKKASGQVHHLLWTIAFAALLLLAPLSMLLPSWTLAVIPAEAIGVSQEAARNEPLRSSLRALSTLSRPFHRAAELPDASEGQVSVATDPISRLARLPFLLWSVGALLALASLIRSMFASSSLVRRCVPVTEPDWLLLCAEIRRQFGIRRAVALRMSTQAISPMTGGWLRPKILLPEVARTWSDERRRLVLQHELVHVKRHDTLRLFGVRLALAVYWFHPLAWLAAWRAAAARERACDEAVLALGTRASTYANHLMELAESLSRWPQPELELPIIERTPLEERLMAIVKSRPASHNLLTSLSITSVLVLVLLSVASAQPAPRTPGPDPAAEAPQAPAASASAPANPAAAKLSSPPGEIARRLRRSSEVEVGSFTLEEFLLVHASGLNRVGEVADNSDLDQVKVRLDAYLRERGLGIDYLKESDLSNASLENLDLRYLNLKEANLTNTDFTNSNLEGAILKEARVGDANFTNANLARVDIHEAEGLVLGQLLTARSLYRTRLPETLAVLIGEESRSLEQARQ